MTLSLIELTDLSNALNKHIKSVKYPSKRWIELLGKIEFLRKELKNEIK